MTRLTLSLVALCSLLVGCPTVDTGADGGDGELVIGPEGGLFVRPGFALDVPRGAVTEETRVFVTIVDTGVPEVPGRARISYGYRFAPRSLTFASPVTLYLPWLEERVPAGVDPDSFDMRRNSGTESWAELPGAKTTQTPFAAVQADTDRLGLFWLTSPSEANIDRLELEPAQATLRVGDTQQYSARVVSPTGATVEVPVTWRAVPARAASIDADGLLTATGAGTVTVTASAGEHRATATALIAGEAAGPVSWLHDNPFPTGNDLYAGALGPGGVAVFAGANGTVLARDGVGGFTRLFSTPGLVLKGVAGTSVSDAVAIGQTAAGAGALLEFKGAQTAPALRVFSPTAISDLGALTFDGTHGMGVGEGNEVVIYRSGAWETEYHPSFERLLSVIGDGEGGFVVVGDLGSLYRWDPTRRVWDSLFDQRLAVKLDAATLTAVAPAEAWAVGADMLWHFTGGGWVGEALPGAHFASVTAVAHLGGRVLVGGQLPMTPGLPAPTALGEVRVRLGDTAGDGGVGAAWATYALRGPQVPRGIFGDADGGYVVGDYGAVWAWDDAAQTLTEVSRGFYGDVADVAVTPDGPLAAVNECDDLRCASRTGVVMHPGASGWEPLGALPPGSGEVLAVAAQASDEVLLSTEAGLLRWDGTDWGPVAVSNQAGPISALRFCGDAVWAVGAGGAVYTGTPTLLRALIALSAQPLTSVACPSPDEVWVAGNKLLASRFGNGSFTVRSDATINQGAWRAVWAPGGGEAWAFGDTWYGVYWNSEAMRVIDATGPVRLANVRGLWGASVERLTLVGAASQPAAMGVALRFDGVQWQLIDLGASRGATCIDGLGDAVWVGTAGGGVLRAAP